MWTGSPCFPLFVSPFLPPALAPLQVAHMFGPRSLAALYLTGALAASAAHFAYYRYGQGSKVRCALSS